MPDSQSSEPGFESLFVTVSKIGHFRSLHWRPCSLSCINEYLAIDSGGNVSDLALARNCCLARMLPGEAELVLEWTGLPGEAKHVKRFERSNGLDTVILHYIKTTFTFFFLMRSTNMEREANIKQHYRWDRYWVSTVSMKMAHQVCTSD